MFLYRDKLGDTGAQSADQSEAPAYYNPGHWALFLHEGTVAYFGLLSHTVCDWNILQI